MSQSSPPFGVVTVTALPIIVKSESEISCTDVSTTLLILTL